MLTGTLLPFPPAGAVKAPQRPLPPTAARGNNFAGAMDGALEPSRSTRREDSGTRAQRRPDAARPRESADRKAVAPVRRAAHSGKPVSARKADRAEAADDIRVERDKESPTETAVMADSSASQPEAKADPKSGGLRDTQADATVGVAVQAVADGAGAVAQDPATPATDDPGTEAVGDSPARGRRWDAPTSEPTGDHGSTARNGAAQKGSGPAPSGQRLGHQARGAQIETGMPNGEPLQTAQNALATAKGDATAGEAAKAGPVTQAIETAAATAQTASAADAATAIENAAAAAEAVAAVETSADGDAGGTETHEQPQPKPQAQSSHASTNETVAVGAASDGMRFTVNGATGNAAYVSAAPRHEEAVLPQIVQSIRLHAVQGTTEARVQLRPEHLGALNITLKVEHNQVTATIQADVAAVRAWIQSHEDSLRQALSEQGLHLAKLVVHEDGQQTSQNDQEGERPRRQPRRRSWRDDDATFEVLV